MRKEKIFKLIIIFLVVIIAINVLQVFSYAGTLAPGEATAEAATPEVDEVEDDSIMGIIKNTIGQWYYVFRYFSIIAMLLVLIFLGIKLSLTTIAEDKAKYKRMLVDWIVGFAIIFGIHYFMAFVLYLNDVCLEGIEAFSDNLAEKLITTENEYALTDISLYETIRTRAYELSIGIGTSGMIMYMVLVYYTIRFTLVYFKRFFTILILTIMAPIAALSYAFTKVNTGKAQILGKWAEEYTFNVFLQSIHALMYSCFVSIALALSDDSIAGFVLSLVMLNFMLKAEKILRKIFKISGKLLDDNADKDIKENLAALTAMKASMTSFGKSNVVKDATASIKRGVGAVTNIGLYAGLSVYDKGLKFSEELKINKDYQDVVKAKEEIEKAKTEEEKKKARAKLENLLNSNSKLAKMEGRRNRLKRYKGQNESKTATGKYFNDKQIDKKANAIIEQEERNGTVSDERKAQIRAEVARKHNDRIKRRVTEFNKVTGKYEVKSGIAKTLKADFNAAVWGDANVKNATKEMLQNTIKGIGGAAMILAAVPQIVADPKIGMPLLAKGIQNAKPLYGRDDYNNKTTARHRRVIRRGRKNNSKNKQEENKKYTFKGLNGKSLNTIKAQMKMDLAGRIIFRINNPSLSVKLFTIPLRLTGISGAARNIQSYAYKVEEAKRDRFERLETAFAIEKKEAYSRDFYGAYDKNVSKMEKEQESALREKTVAGIMLMHKEETGEVFEVNDKKMQFKDTSIGSLTQIDLIDNAILKVAIKNKVSDLKQLDTNNQFIKLEVIKELGNLGLLTNIEDIRLDDHEKQISSLMEKIDERIDTITKEKPEVLKEKLTQLVITEYMQENDIDSPEELRTEEHRENIKQQVLTFLDETAPQPETEEEILDERIKEIVAVAMETTSSKEEFEEVLQKQIGDIIYEYEEKQISSDTTSEIREELGKKRTELAPEKPIIDILPERPEEEIILTEDGLETPEEKSLARTIAEKQTKTIIENVDSIISQIREEKEQRQYDLDFVESIIESVQIVENEEEILTPEESRMLSSETVVEEILTQDARRLVRKSKEFKEMNGRLRKIDELKVTQDTPEIDETVIEENITQDTVELISKLLLIKEQDKVAVELKVKSDSSERKKMMQIDEERFGDIYNYTGIDEILETLNNKKKERIS